MGGRAHISENKETAWGVLGIVGFVDACCGEYGNSSYIRINDSVLF